MTDLFAALERMGWSPKDMPGYEGAAKQTFFRECKDGWLIGYTTTKVDGGKWDGKYLVFAYRPTGKGARSGKGKAVSHTRSYVRAFSKRRMARDRAEAIWWQHERG